MHATALHRSVACLTLFTFLATACGGRPTPPRPPGPGDDLVLVQAEAAEGLQLRLSDGQRGAGSYDRPPVAAATPLADADADALLRRAAALKADPKDRADFAIRPRSTPPPRTGTTLAGTFPPAPGANLPPPATVDAGAPLEVVRYQPEGDVPLVPQLSITFSQPMVAVTSQDDAARTVPVTLTPTPAGHWRWLGTKTLIFDPDVRFPQATTYQVEVPAGTRSATGNVLASAVRFSFTTPPPQLVTMWPQDESQRRDVPMFLRFDQRIDPAAVLATVSLDVGGRTLGVRQLGDAEIAAHPIIKSLVESAKAEGVDGRWLAMKATETLPADTAVRVVVGPKTPSAEGPLRTTARQDFSFRTYAPLRIERAECGWGGRCPPGTPFGIQFNNALDEAAFAPGDVKVSPAIPGMQLVNQGASLAVIGATAARTTYKVTLPANLRDEFGQTLGQAKTLSFQVGTPEPTFYGPDGLLVVDPGAATPSFDVFTAGYPELKVTLRRVVPGDLPGFSDAMQNLWNEDSPPRWPGTKVFEGTIKTSGTGDGLRETAIDLSAALPASKLGHVLAIVEPSPWKEAWDPPRLYAWLQVTRLGLSAHVDGQELVAMASELADGKAASGVALTMLPSKATATTDGGGLARIALPRAGSAGSDVLLARRGDDTAFLTSNGGWWNDYPEWVRRDRGTELAWYVVDDRQLYKPGEEVRLKGWLRPIDYGEGGDVRGLAGLVSAVRYVVVDPVGNELLKGRATVNAAGGFDTRFTLPKVANLGYASVQFTAEGRLAGDHYHSLQIQEFRRPEFEVTAAASSGTMMVGEGGDVTVSARYYAGGGLPGAPVRWDLHSNVTTFTPPGRDDYVFGEWRPWWGYRSWWGDDRGDPTQTWSHEGTTDAVGDHVLHLDYLSVNPARPMSVTASATRHRRQPPGLGGDRQLAGAPVGDLRRPQGRAPLRRARHPDRGRGDRRRPRRQGRGRRAHRRRGGAPELGVEGRPLRRGAARSAAVRDHRRRRRPDLQLRDRDRRHLPGDRDHHRRCRSREPDHAHGVGHRR
ncbi:MAG: Ig-like domain-containing protein [Kofleriaceae bacterium]